MSTLVIIFVVVCFCMKLTQCIIFNAHNIIIYSLKDLWFFIKEKKWERFSCFGIDMIIGMFGKGKTLFMVHVASKLYKKYGDSLRFYANFELKDIPYVPLSNFNQLLKIAKDPEEGVQGYVILVDEIQSLLSHRNYASFPLELVGVLTQQRKLHMYIMCTAQRFFMVDKIWRSITTNVIDCHKYWRFAHNSYYDAWDYENAMNVSLIKRQYHDWWFVKDRDYNAYDTSEMISETAASDFISNEEAIVRKGLDSTVNELAVKNHSRRRKKALSK
ncbi:MAG: hypothetical protein IJ429_02120 [Lachnospiraceae bacterium]|nr:hypothetical protein [Lachnospiraceae bacterium]